MEDKNKLKCPHCGTVLERNVTFDGADWNSELGANSGFDWTVSLDCPKWGCGYIHIIGRIRKETDICEQIEPFRPYNKAGTYRKRGG